MSKRVLRVVAKKVGMVCDVEGNCDTACVDDVQRKCFDAQQLALELEKHAWGQGKCGQCCGRPHDWRY